MSKPTLKGIYRPSLKAMIAFSCALLFSSCSPITSNLAGDDDPVQIPPPVDENQPLSNGSSPGSTPGSALVMLDLPAFNQRSSVNWGPILKDIVNHEAPGDNNSYDDMITLGHETTHGINSYARNSLNNSGKRANGFYLLNSKIAIIEEPKMRKSQVAPFVPVPLRNSRFDLYIAGSPDWDDRPTYVLDEWIAYINGSAAGVELVKLGLWRAGWRDGVTGTMDFCVFSVALGMAIEKFDPAYFKANTQFREFLAFNLQRGMKVFFEGRKMPDFADDNLNRYYETFRDSQDAAAMRDFLYRTYGEAWVKSAVFTD